MSIQNNFVKIINNKVIFSPNILNYFENLRNEENSEWIDKYFENLSDSSNLNSLKTRNHHIIPVFTFKNKTHKNRKETLPLANEIKENIIKLSIYNHIIAHFCLWMIFKNYDSKSAFQRMCSQEKIENLSYQQIIKIAELQNACSKENQSKEERLKKKKESDKNYHNKNKKNINLKQKLRYQFNKKDRLEKARKYRKLNKTKILEYDKKRYILHKVEKTQYKKIWYNKNKEVILANHKNYYKTHKDKIFKYKKEWDKNNKEKISTYNKKYNNQTCYDPIKKDKCGLHALQTRKRRHSDLYKDINPKDCIIKS